MSVIHVNDDNFQEEVLNCKDPIIIDFYASWCGPCATMSPIIHHLGEQNKEKAIKIIKVNIDQSPRISNTFQVRSVPTIVLFSKGKELDRTSGVLPLDALQDIANVLIEENLKGII